MVAFKKRNQKRLQIEKATENGCSNNIIFAALVMGFNSSCGTYDSWFCLAFLLKEERVYENSCIQTKRIYEIYYKDNI